jgi:glucose-6-phosphate isomerase
MNNPSTEAALAATIAQAIERSARFICSTGKLDGAAVSGRYLHDLKGCFYDEAAFSSALEEDDRLVYSVAGVETPSSPGELGYGIGVLQPGLIGNEYFLTKGHLHAWRPAAEIYVGLSGSGLMLFEDEDGENAKAVELVANSIVYVPGNTAHRTVNVGAVPLTYIGIYPSEAGHDYGALAERNFSLVVLDQNNTPTVFRRSDLRRAPQKS